LSLFFIEPLNRNETGSFQMQDYSAFIYARKQHRQ